MRNATLSSAALGDVAPVAGAIVAQLWLDHPCLERRPEACLAILAVTARFINQLRTADPRPPRLDPAEIRRALLFLRNTERPFAVLPETSATTLFDHALALVEASDGVTAMTALRRAVAAIVHVARARSPRTRRWR